MAVDVVTTAGANLWWSKALELMPAAVCSLLYALLPVVTAVLGVLILNEQFTWKFLIGGLLIITGVVVAILGERSYGSWLIL